LVFFVHANVYSQFTIEQVLRSPFPSELTASPKGERVAWVFDKEGHRNIWVAEGPQFKARQLTKYNEDDCQELTDLGFSSDGNWIVFVRGGDKNSRGEVPNPTNDASGTKQQVMAVNWATGEVRALSEGGSPIPSANGATIVFSKGDQLWSASLADVNQKPAQLFVARGTVGAPHWSPDGRYLAFSSGRVDHSFIGVYDTIAKTIKYISPSVDRDSAPRWSPDGKSIAFSRQEGQGSDASQHFLIETLDGKPEREIGIPAQADIFDWTPDGRGISYLLYDPSGNTRHLYVQPLKGGPPVQLTHFDTEPSNILAYAWSRN